MSDWMANPPKSASEQWELAQQGKDSSAKTESHDIKTAHDRDQLAAQRKTPEHEMHLRPPGVPQPDHDAAEREARIRQINAALQQAKIKAKEDFEKAQ